MLDVPLADESCDHTITLSPHCSETRWEWELFSPFFQCLVEDVLVPFYAFDLPEGSGVEVIKSDCQDDVQQPDLPISY